jgi:hypothetical protein
MVFPAIATWFPETLQAAARSQAVPEAYQKILERQRRAPTLEDDDWASDKKK